MPKRYEDPDLSMARARLAFHEGSTKGVINMVDGPREYDPAGTVVVVIVDMTVNSFVRCALSRQQAKNLASKLMEFM